MSEPLFQLGGLRFWSEPEILARERFVQEASEMVRRELRQVNPAWQFARVEGPCLHPESQISDEYNEDDVFVTNHDAMGAPLMLRAETTASSYRAARHLMAQNKWARLPLCVWQVGKSFRRELNDGASARKLRFNEFYQLEFQCIYRADTKADYRLPVMEAALRLCARATGRESRLQDSDRLPSYSESTVDIELSVAGGWREVASCSIRNDFGSKAKVFELAIGLDRIIDLRHSNE